MDGTLSLTIHALVYLNHKDCTLPSETLAESICTNPIRVRRVMVRLKKVGLIETKKGTAGSYRFHVDAKKLSLNQVAQALDIRFADVAQCSEDTNMDCLVASGMADIIDSIYWKLDEQCRESLRKATIMGVDSMIF